MTRNPDIEEVPVGTTVTLTCSVTSYPESTIRWEQQALNEHITLNSSTMDRVMHNMFSVITNSTIMFNSSDIKSASKYCCIATNVIGTTIECLDFTERGMLPA